jgi:hypothetical protein
VRLPEDVRAVTIGRDRDNFLSVDDEGCSRQHVSITRRFGRYVLRDLNSRNGVFLNDAAVTKAVLKNNDRIRIGATVLRFALDEADPFAHVSYGPLDTLPEDRISRLCAASVAVGVAGLFWWPLAVIALLLGAFSAMNVALRPKLRGMWLGVAGASLGGLRLLVMAATALAVTGAAWSEATRKIECRRRLGAIHQAIRHYRDARGGGAPDKLLDLLPDHLSDPDALYCPSVERRHGRRNERAAYHYNRGNVSEIRGDRWVARDPDLDAHGDGGNLLFSGGQARWLDAREFIQATSEAPR